MLKKIVGFAIGLLLATTASAADLVLKNGRFYTLDTSQTWADSVAIDDGRIAYVGDAVGLQDFINDETEQYDLMGRLVLPYASGPCRSVSRLC